MGTSPKILLVDDDKVLAGITQEYLEAKGHDIKMVNDANTALDTFKKQEFDICILDIKMPFKDGFTLAEELRAIQSDISIIFLTGQLDKEDKIKGLTLGADDYITKPFSMEELYLRINNIYSRIKGKISEKTVHQIGLYSFNGNNRKLKLGDIEFALSEMESQLLSLFMENSDHRITREQALNRIWEDENLLKTRSLNVYINKLRRRFKEDSSIEIINIYGSGYQLLIK